MNKKETDINNKIKHEKRITLIGTLTLVLAAALIFGFLILGLYNLNLIDLPDYLTYMFNVSEQPSETEPIFYNEERILKAIKSDRSADDKIVKYDIAAEDLQKCLTEAPFFDEYTITLQVTFYGKNSPLVRVNRIWRSGDKYRVDTYAGSVLLKSTVCDGKQTAITDYKTYDIPITRLYPISDEFTLETQAGIPSVASFLELDGITDLQINLLRTPTNNLYCVTYGYADINQNEAIYISPEYGLIVNAETNVNGKVVYSVSGSDMSEGINGYTGNVNNIFICK